MQDQARATETISIIKEVHPEAPPEVLEGPVEGVPLNNLEALNYITGLMRKYVGTMKYVTWKAEIKDTWFYVRIAQTDGEAARELHISTRFYIEGDYDLLDTELASLVGQFMEEVQNVKR